ncbi:MAG: thioredoxin family protein [Bacteroidota bacterium]
MNPITREDLARAFSYPAYLSMVQELYHAGKSTGPKQSESLLNFSGLNLRRMDRVAKKLSLTEESETALAQLKESQVWVVLTEGWCGDAAQTLPIIYRMAEASEQIELKILLRDEHLPIMDRYLTNGGRSIPKLIVLRADDLTELTQWGPRPAEAQKLLYTYKAMDPKPPYEEFNKQLQMWYNKDKGISTQAEIAARLNQIHLIEA